MSGVFLTGDPLCVGVIVLAELALVSPASTLP